MTYAVCAAVLRPSGGFRSVPSVHGPPGGRCRMVFTMYRHESRSGGREIRKVHEENLGAGDGLVVVGEQGGGATWFPPPLYLRSRNQSPPLSWRGHHFSWRLTRARQRSRVRHVSAGGPACRFGGPAGAPRGASTPAPGSGRGRIAGLGRAAGAKANSSAQGITRSPSTTNCLIAICGEMVGVQPSVAMPRHPHVTGDVPHGATARLARGPAKGEHPGLTAGAFAICGVRTRFCDKGLRARGLAR